MRGWDRRSRGGAIAGKTAPVPFTGWLGNGKSFAGSVDRGQPFSFHPGVGEVTKGWDEGMEGVKVGGKRMLTIPAQLGYGARGAAGVMLLSATWIFDIKLLGL
jgi:FKBP-type peptidyl-prolyl cis-trans isomerase FkpA